MDGLQIHTHPCINFAAQWKEYIIPLGGVNDVDKCAVPLLLSAALNSPASKVKRM